MQPTLPILTSLALLTLGSASCVLRAPFDGLDQGSAAPEIQVQAWVGDVSMEPEPEPLAALRGKSVLLEFWSSDCPPCVASIPKMKRVASRYEDSLHVVTVHLDLDPEQPTSAEELETFLLEAGIQYPVGLDSEGTSWDSFDFHYLPHAVLIDAQGLVEWSGNLVYYDLDTELEERLGPARGVSLNLGASYGTSSTPSSYPDPETCEGDVCSPSR
jgi:thiol-disulfide isomerase/thioredoxin